jgi:hypothetical protein
MAAFKVIDQIPIGLTATSPAHLAPLFYLGFQGLALNEIVYSRSNVDFFVLARAIVLSMGIKSEKTFVKFDTSVWKNGEDLNLVNSFLRESSLDYNSLLRAIITTSVENNNDWTTLIFIALTFGWDVIFGSLPSNSFVVLSHDSIVMASSNQVAEELSRVFW